MPLDAAAGLQTGPFFSTPEQRLALARERFFVEGVRPTGLVPEPVLQSWHRCRVAGLAPGASVDVAPVSPLRLEAGRRRARALCAAAAPVFNDLGRVLGASPVRVALTDAQALVLQVNGPATITDQPLLAQLVRPGVTWSEARLGSTAVALVLVTGQALQLRGGEHYLDALAGLHAAAAPVLDAQGHLAGVLALCTEQHGFGFDPVAVTGQYASTVEHHLLRQQQSRDQVLVEFQTTPELLGTPLAALLGIEATGQVAWLNSVARRLTGHDPGHPLVAAQQLLGLDAAGLQRLTQAGGPVPLALASGLTVWVRASRPVTTSPDSAASPIEAMPGAAAAESAPARLAEASRALIDRTLAACDGNVSEAARRLGISRGRIYRHLQASTEDPISKGSE